MPPCLLLPLLVSPAAVAPAPARWHPLDEGLRQRIDRAALARPPEPITRERIDQAGNVSAWALDALDADPTREVEKAAAQDRTLRARHRVLPTPPDAQRLLDRLAGQFPPHLRPPGERFRLAVLDAPGFRAWATGAGYVYITRPYLDALTRAGEGPLAFVLAEQIAHTSLGHCRRGWHRLDLEADLARRVEKNTQSAALRDALQTGVRASGNLVEFLYTRDQQYLADYVALQLVRNAGLPVLPAFDPVRQAALQRHPGLANGDGPPRTPLLEGRADPLLRLGRLLREQGGLVEGPPDFGLLLYDRLLDRVRPLSDGEVGALARPIVFVHGMLGGNDSFREYLRHFGEQAELFGRPLLVFRWPSNGSLAQAGLFLEREVRRVVRAPERATFVCHSAGGLVFRYYAEARRGAFARAVLIGSPHAGSNLTDLKALADVSEVAVGLGEGVGPALSGLARQGRGEIGLDLHPDSLFLRHLGHDPALAKRYHVVIGTYFSAWRGLALQVGFVAGRRVLLNQAERLSNPWVREQTRAGLARLKLPEEVLVGDLVVTARSAHLPGAGEVTRVRLHHLALRTDPEMARRMLAWVRAGDR